MKKFSYLLFAALICSFSLFTSCKDNDDNSDNSGFDDLKNYKYSELSVEKQKEKLQGDANSLLADLEGLKNNEAINVLKALNELLNISPIELEESVALRSSDDVISLSYYFGSYKWNNSKKDWDYTAANDKLELEFPVGTKTGKILVPKSASSVVIESEDGEKIEIPKDIAAKIYLNAAEVGSISASSEIVNGYTVPALTKLSFTLGEYTLSTSLSKRTPNIATSEFKKGNKTLIDAKINLTGNLDNSIQDKDPGQITGNAVINVLDAFAFAGSINFTQYTVAMNKADEDYDNKDSENYAKASAKAWNDNCELYLISLSDKTKFAKLTQKAKSYNNYWENVPVLQFGDNTEIETEVYFSTGFDLFIQNLMEFVSAFK
jgi:hypothetical protein